MFRHPEILRQGYSPEGLISTNERAAASRLKDDVARAGRMAHHATRRLILGELTGIAPAKLVISHTADGAAEIVEAAAPPISSSRSGDWTCVGVGQVGRVGVDIEEVKPCNWRAMLGMLSNENESEAWTAFLQEHDDAAVPFLRLWTAKEAILKADGRGFRAGPRQVHIDPPMFRGNRQAFRVSAFGRTFDVWTTAAEGTVVSFAMVLGAAS